MNIGKDGPVVSPDRVQNGGDIAYPAAMGTWITVRVPADQLTGAMDELVGAGDGGVVLHHAAGRHGAGDRPASAGRLLEASVARLTELMSKAGSVGDPSQRRARSERQAELESYQQQLTSLEDQVALSSLTVSLVEKTERIEADPAGFGDGLVAGWNGLVATLNGLVIGVGFLLPLDRGGGGRRPWWCGASSRWCAGGGRGRPRPPGLVDTDADDAP